MNPLEQVYNLGLDRYIQGRYRFIADQKLWFYYKSSGKYYSLPLSTRKLVRIPVVENRLKADSCQHIQHHLLAVLGVADIVDFQRLHNLFSNTHIRVKSSQRILENHLHIQTYSSPLLRLKG